MVISIVGIRSPYALGHQGIGKLGRIRLIDDPFVAYLFQISLFTSIASPYLVEKNIILERIFKKTLWIRFAQLNRRKVDGLSLEKKLVPFPDNAARRYVSSVKAREMRLFRYFSYQRQTSVWTVSIRYFLVYVIFSSNNFVPRRLFFFINNIDELNNSRGGSRIWRKKGRNRWSDMRNLLTVIRFSGSETVKTKDLRAIDLRVIARPCRWLARGRG